MSQTAHPAQRIAIIGAGIAGLNAALTLHDAGVACDIYESSEHIGGRMHSDGITWQDGMITEWCGEFIDGDHTAIRELAARFGLQLVELGMQGGSFSERILYFFNRYVSPGELEAAFAALAPTLQHQMQAAGYPTTYDHYTEMGYYLDHLSVPDWVARYVENGHDSVLGRLLNGACTGLFGLDAQQQSSLNLVYMFGPNFASQDNGRNSKPGTSKIAGGNQKLPLAMAAYLPQHTIHLNHRLTHIEQDKGITLTFAAPHGSFEVVYDKVILTLPFSTLRHVDYHKAGFDARKQEAIEQLGYGTISKLILQFDTCYWYQSGRWPVENNGFVVTDLDIQTLWDTSRGQQGTHGLLLDYTSGRHGAAYKPTMPYSSTEDAAHQENAERIQHYAQACLQQLEQVFPGISHHYTGRAALSYPTGDPNLLGSYACWRVGQYTQFGGYERVPQGAIHFAGEHCSVEWQGYMEGGAREGVRAAQEILASIATH